MASRSDGCRHRVDPPDRPVLCLRTSLDGWCQALHDLWVLRRRDEVLLVCDHHVTVEPAMIVTINAIERRPFPAEETPHFEFWAFCTATLWDYRLGDPQPLRSTTTWTAHY